MRFAFHADAVALRVRSTGQRVGAQQGRGREVWAQAHGQKLPRPRGYHRLAVERHQAQRDHARALAVDLDHPHPPEAGPRRLRGPAVRRLLDQLPERPLPSLAQRRDPQRANQIAARVAWQVQQAVELGHGHSLRAALDPLHHVAGPDLPLLEHPEVEAGTAVCDQQRGHPWLAHPDSDAVTGDPRLADLEQRRTDAVTVTDADLVVREPLHGEILAELPVGEIVAAEELLPVAVRVDLVDEHRAVDAAVPLKVALAVAVDVEAANHPATVNGVLPDPGVNDPAFPFDVAGDADVHREQPASRSERHHLPALGRIAPLSAGSAIGLLNPTGSPSGRPSA